MNPSNTIPKVLSFSYEKALYSNYNDHYQPEGAIKRKIMAIPQALFSGIILSISHLMKAIFYGIPKACTKDFNPLKKNAYSLVRDLEEALGWGIIIFNDKKGFELIQKSRSHKKCYSSCENSIKFILKRKKEIPTYSQEELHKVLKDLSSDELGLLSDDQIRKLDVSLLVKDQVESIFSPVHLKYTEKRRRFALLSSKQVPQIIENEEIAYLISDEQLKNLDFALLKNKKCLTYLFPFPYLEPNIKERFDSLSLKNKKIVIQSHIPPHREYFKKDYKLDDEQYAKILNCSE